jgi:hypothetical protein
MTHCSTASPTAQVGHVTVKRGYDIPTVRDTKYVKQVTLVADIFVALRSYSFIREAKAQIHSFFCDC